MDSDQNSIKWANDAQSNLISIIVLEIISRDSSYGYKIKKKVEQSMNEVFTNYEFKISSLYTLLRRLENKSLVESFKNVESAKNERDKNRTFYKITSKGNIELENAWGEWKSLINLYTIINKHYRGQI